MPGDDERDDLLTDVDRIQLRPVAGWVEFSIRSSRSLASEPAPSRRAWITSSTMRPITAPERRMAGRSSRVSKGNVDQLAYFSMRFIAEMNGCGRRRSKEPNG